MSTINADEVAAAAAAADAGPPARRWAVMLELTVASGLGGPALEMPSIRFFEETERAILSLGCDTVEQADAWIRHFGEMPGRRLGYVVHEPIRWRGWRVHVNGPVP